MAVSRIGQRVGPFELAERIESDGFTTLFRAVRPAGSREPRVVCVRMADDPRDERAAGWIRNEYDVLRALSEPPHPAIPRPYGFYASRVAVALEDLDGVSVAEALELRRQGRVPVDAATAVDILVELAQTLRHAHATTGAQGPVLHGHISPDRVHLTRDGQVKLLGFGQEAGRREPSYTAPEQAAGAFSDARSDQWALGSLGVELLLGQPVYSGTPDPMAMALTGRVGPWLDRLERRWPEVCRVLARCLAPAAGDRYPREADLVRDLLAASRTIGGRADVRALASRVAALMPQPAPVSTAPRVSAPAAPPDPDPGTSGPGISGGGEPVVDPTLVPMEDDVDPDSVRSAALQPPPDRDRTDDHFDTGGHARVDLSGQATARANPTPILRDARGRLEDEITDTVPGAVVETLPIDDTEDEPSPALAAARVEPREPDTDHDTPLAGELPLADDPRVAAIAAPLPDPSDADDPLGTLGVSPLDDDAQASAGGLDSLDDALDDDDERTDPGVEIGDIDTLDDAPAVGGLPDSALPDAGLRWSEMVAIVMMALLLVTGLYFLAWQFL